MGFHIPKEGFWGCLPQWKAILESLLQWIQKGWTYRDAVRGADSSRPKKPRIIQEVEIPDGNGQFLGIVRYSKKRCTLQRNQQRHHSAAAAANCNAADITSHSPFKKSAPALQPSVEVIWTLDFIIRTDIVCKCTNSAPRTNKYV